MLGIFQHIVVAVRTAYEGGASGIVGAEKTPTTCCVTDIAAVAVPGGLIRAFGNVPSGS